MPFNSVSYIFIFLPIILTVFYFLSINERLRKAAIFWLNLSSLYFYSLWGLKPLLILAISILINYVLAIFISKTKSKRICLMGVIVNLLILGYLKYYNFLVTGINVVFEANLNYLKYFNAIGVSFYTLNQIGFLVDLMKGKAERPNFQKYLLFSTFFPYILSGPIVRYSEISKEFNLKKKFNHKNLSLGLFLFFIGLLKKIIISEYFAQWVQLGFDQAQNLTFAEAWVTSISYTIQLFFDFSGYTDMALGSALMLGVTLPENFNSPYRSKNIQEFWRRWHISLSRFFRDYVYIPLGGSKKGLLRTVLHILIVFMLTGLWHGASLTFIIWGLLHGFGLIVHRLFTKLNLKLNKIVAWILTINFVNIAWVFFRAKKLIDAVQILRAMFGFKGISLPNRLAIIMPFARSIGIKFNSTFFDGSIKKLFLFSIISFMVSIYYGNSNQIMEDFKPTFATAVFIMLVIFFCSFNINSVQQFLYAKF